MENNCQTGIELIDEEAKLLAFYEKIRSHLELMKNGCLVTLDITNVLIYKSGQKKIFEN